VAREREILIESSRVEISYQRPRRLEMKQRGESGGTCKQRHIELACGLRILDDRSRYGSTLFRQNRIQKVTTRRVRAAVASPASGKATDKC
jgi:hypothetical protein